MLRRTPALATASLLLWACGWIFLGTGGCLPSDGPVNMPLDLDGDALPDSVTVGDFDGDGVREMDDIQNAIDALTDPGPKHISVEAGGYLAPPAPALRPGRTHAILELRSYTTLACAGIGATVLHGTPPGANSDYAVLANDDHANGNDAVWIRDCEIDGGMPASYAASSFTKNRRMGVYFRRTRNSRVTDSYVHDTVHTGLYSSVSSGDQFLRNVIEDAGGWGDTSGTANQPCIYLYTFGGGSSVSNFEASDNTLRRCRHSGLNTRAEDTDAPGDAIRNALWARNSVEDTGSACISVRGADGLTVRDLRCHSAGAVLLNRGFGSGYRSSGNDNANSNITIEDVVMTDVDVGQAGLDVGAWVDGLGVRRFSVDGMRDANGVSLYRECAWLQRPLRNAVLEDISLGDCGKEGMLVTALAPSSTAAETLTLRRVLVTAVDQTAPLDTGMNAGIHFQGAHARLLLEDLDLSEATGPELRFDNAVSNATLRRVTIDSVDPGWLGAFAEGAVPACTAARQGKWITTSNGTSATDCVFSAGTTGLTPARCGCLAGAWGPIFWTASPGIEFATGVSHANVVLEDVTVANARAATGARVRGALSGFSVSTILGLDDSLATDLPQRSAIDFDAASGWSVTGASCVGTQPGVPCIE